MTDKPNIMQSEHDTILVVEDEILIRTAIAEYLRHCGYRVIEATSADEAMVMLNKADIHIDVVFSDVEMPGSMDGFGLAQWVRAHKPGLPIILTGSIQKAAKEAGDLCEEGPHLAKPYEPDHLVDWIKRLRASSQTKN